MFLNGRLWSEARSPELRPLLAGHYSRRRTLRPGMRFGGVGDPYYATSAAGSAAVAVYQTQNGWNVAWRDFPSWWVAAFRRSPSDAAKASALVAELIEELQCRRPGPIFTAVNASKVQSATPGLCFIRAGFRPFCSTRPLRRCRSLLILRWTPGR